jgi:uncharacterized protein (UPF0333 family)
MNRLSFVAVLLFLGIALFPSCKKVEGEGGSSSIIGKIIANKYNSGGTLISTYDAQKQDVFIIYGEGSTVQDDKVETSYDGNFKFEFLEKGKYTIYTYEKCSTCPSGDQAVIRTIEISKAKETVNVGTIEIRD